MHGKVFDKNTTDLLDKIDKIKERKNMSSAKTENKIIYTDAEMDKILGLNEKIDDRSLKKYDDYVREYEEKCNKKSTQQTKEDNLSFSKGENPMSNPVPEKKQEQSFLGKMVGSILPKGKPETLNQVTEINSNNTPLEKKHNKKVAFPFLNRFPYNEYEKVRHDSDIYRKYKIIYVETIYPEIFGNGTLERKIENSTLKIKDFYKYVVEKCYKNGSANKSQSDIMKEVENTKDNLLRERFVSLGGGYNKRETEKENKIALEDGFYFSYLPLKPNENLTLQERIPNKKLQSLEIRNSILAELKKETQGEDLFDTTEHPIQAKPTTKVENKNKDIIKQMSSETKRIMLKKIAQNPNLSIEDKMKLFEEVESQVK
jgi:hypothetical protein